MCLPIGSRSVLFKEETVFTSCSCRFKSNYVQVHNNWILVTRFGCKVALAWGWASSGLPLSCSISWRNSFPRVPLLFLIRARIVLNLIASLSHSSFDIVPVLRYHLKLTFFLVNPRRRVVSLIENGLLAPKYSFFKLLHV